MGDQDHRFQHRWEFRTGNDCDSSSDEDHLRPIFSIEPKVTKHKLVTCPAPKENTEQNMHSPTSPPFTNGEKENHPSFEKGKRKPNKPCKANEREVGSKKTKKETYDNEPSNADMIDLRGYMESLVEAIKSTREDLLAWMNDEINCSSKGDGTTTHKPNGTKSAKRQNTKSRKALTNNPNASRRKKAAKGAQNCEDGSSGRTSPKTNGECMVLPKVVENIVIAIPAEKNEKQKGKNSRLSSKKQKVVGTTSDKQVEKDFGKASTTSADNSTRFTTVGPLNQCENSEGNPVEIEGEKSALNSTVNVSSHQLNFDLRAKQKDALFSQNGLSNANDYKNNTGPSICNLNGSEFPFSFASQGLNSGVGMLNFPSQFGLQYLAQGNRMHGVYRESPIFSNANHTLLESFGAFNQHLKFNLQQGGAMGLQYPDIRRGAYNQGNIPDQ